MAILLAAALLASAVAGTGASVATTRPNVLLLTIDCLRADRLGCYGYGRPTSPGIDKLAVEGVLFEDCVGQSGWTSPGLVTVLTGLYPETTGIRGRASVPAPGLPALPLLFRKAGYEVPALSYLTSLQNYWNLGYDAPADDLIRPEEDRLVADFLERPHDRPFFAWYHYRFLHLPYAPPDPWRTLFVRGPWPVPEPSGGRIAHVLDNVLLKRGSVPFTRAEQTIVSDLYDASVRRMDAYVSSVLASLDRTGLASNTIVVLTADHGEELFERGFVGHASTSFDGTLHEEILHVPLLVRAPGRLGAGIRVSTLCGQIDVAPTLAAMTGLTPSGDGFQGLDLTAVTRGQRLPGREAVFSSSTRAGYQTPAEDEKRGLDAVTTPDWRWIVERPAGQRQLYDRRRDRAERQPVRDRPEVERRLAELAADHEAECSIRRLSHAAMAPGTAPPALAIAAPVLEKPDRALLDFDSTGGSIEVRVRSASPGPFVAEYEIGRGVYKTSGSVALAKAVQRFGPFSRELWRTLVLWNPWRFRVGYPGGRPMWSPWVEFRVAP